MTKEEIRLGLRLMKIQQIMSKGNKCYKLANKMIHKLSWPITAKVLDENFKMKNGG